MPPGSGPSIKKQRTGQFNNQTCNAFGGRQSKPDVCIFACLHVSACYNMYIYTGHGLNREHHCVFEHLGDLYGGAYQQVGRGSMGDQPSGAVVSGLGLLFCQGARRRTVG